MRPVRNINGNNRDQKTTILAYVDPSNKTSKECPGTNSGISFVVVGLGRDTLKLDRLANFGLGARLALSN
jgi:hypothetical protein